MTINKRPRASSKEFDEINKQVFSPHVYNSPARASGRTFRMLVQAVLACSSATKRKTIYVIGVDKNHCHILFKQVLNILESVGGLDVVCDEICMPNGSRLLFRSQWWFDKHKGSMGISINDDDVFEDHYTLECRYGKR